MYVVCEEKIRFLFVLFFNKFFRTWDIVNIVSEIRHNKHVKSPYNTRPCAHSLLIDVYNSRENVGSQQSEIWLSSMEFPCLLPQFRRID